MKQEKGVEEKIVYKDLCYIINGLLFKTHNCLGRFCREKQYGDFLENLLKEEGLCYKRECPFKVEGINNPRTNIVDFEIEEKILLELKAKPIIKKEDYEQIKRYLKVGNYKLGLIVNFRNHYLKPVRVLNHS